MTTIWTLLFAFAARLLRFIGVLRPLKDVTVRAVYMGQEQAVFKIHLPQSAGRALQEIEQTTLKGFLKDGPVLLRPNDELLQGRIYEFVCTQAPGAAFASERSSFQTGIRQSPGKDFGSFLKRGQMKLSENFWVPGFEEFWAVLSRRRFGTLRVLACKSEKTKAEKTRYYESFAQLLCSILKVMEPLLPSASISRPANALPKYILDSAIGVPQGFEVDIGWAGIQQAVLTPTSAYTCMRGIVEMKSIELSNSRLQEDGSLQLCSYSNAIALERLDSGLDSSQMIAGIFSDGERVSGALYVPDGNSGTLYFSQIHNLVNASGAVNVDSTAFKHLVHFLWTSEMLILRAAALDCLAEARQSEEWSVKVSWQEELKHITVISPIQQNVFRVKLQDEPLIAKIGPSIELCQALASAHDDTLLQVETESRLVGLSFGDSLPAYVCHGREQKSGASILLMRDKGVPLQCCLQPAELMQCLEDMCNALLTLQEYRIAHNDVCPSNILIRDNYTLIDFGFSDDIGKPQHNKDLLHSSSEALKGLPTTVLSDVQSLAYTIVRLSGQKLPWEEAAIQGNVAEVIRLRYKFHAKPKELLSGLPMYCKQFVVGVCAALLDRAAFDLRSFTTKGRSRDSAKGIL